jgi:hypothetical protein
MAMNMCNRKQEYKLYDVLPVWPVFHLPLQLLNSGKYGRQSLFITGHQSHMNIFFTT